MTIERLPPEVIANIAAHLPEQHGEDGRLVRPNIATVSRAWQSMVEPDVFCQLKINNTVELETFATVFSTPQSRRRSLLKHLRYTIILPTYTDQECSIYETNEDRTANNKVVAEALRALFIVLSSWGSDPAVGFSLLLIIHSPMDVRHRDRDKLEQDKCSHALGRRQDVFEKRYEYSYIRLADTDLNLLPAVSCITELLCTYGGGDRQIHPSTQAALTLTKTPNLQKLTWRYKEPGVYLSLCRGSAKNLSKISKPIRSGPPSAASISKLSRTSTCTTRGCRTWFSHTSMTPCHQHSTASSARPKISKQSPTKAPSMAPSSGLLPLAKNPLSQYGPPSSTYQCTSTTEPQTDNGTSKHGRRSRPAPTVMTRKKTARTMTMTTNQLTLPPDAANYFAPGYGTPEETRASLAYAKSLERIPDPADGTFDSEK
ncbi:hypothetical protein QBC40DRAFT_277447 [Triangularia verruculosa]|uniref:F-box domain-containing protein n=1 Tax=Triangularia verruculosa TaxID=2587418 RepID=A0AAN6XJP1_9PEZI|nr:hypothetical protein QBC40DRAFT_277447 [Triangularia verruculosa]